MLITNDPETIAKLARDQLENYYTRASDMVFAHRATAEDATTLISELRVKLTAAQAERNMWRDRAEEHDDHALDRDVDAVVDEMTTTTAVTTEEADPLDAAVYIPPCAECVALTAELDAQEPVMSAARAVWAAHQSSTQRAMRTRTYRGRDLAKAVAEYDGR